MINQITDGPTIAEKCRRALGSLHCELTPREKRVLDVFVKHSFDLGQDAAMFGASDQIALLARIHKGDVSNAISSLRRTRIVRQERANALAHFRRPMLYYVDPHALVRVAQEPTLGTGGEFIEKLRADTATWLAHANRCYPLQPDLIPPEPRLLEMALAEISRASVLADDLPQNGEPKPASSVTGEAYPPEQEDGPGLTPLPSESPLDADYVKVGLELGLSPAQVARLARQKLAAGEPGVVGKFPTTSPESLRSWKISNHSRARDLISSDADGSNILPSEHLKGDARGLVGNSPTTAEPEFVFRAARLLAEYGEPWEPPTGAQKVFEEVSRCMGAVMGNYSGWWWMKCVDPDSRGDVVEAVATWKLARHHPKHKPWGGGAWKREFHRRERARLGGAPVDEGVATT